MGYKQELNYCCCAQNILSPFLWPWWMMCNHKMAYVNDSIPTNNSVTLETCLWMNGPCYTSFLTNSMHANPWESTIHYCDICNSFWHYIPLHIIMVSFMQPKPQSCNVSSKLKFQVMYSLNIHVFNNGKTYNKLKLIKIVICTLLGFSPL